MLYKKNDIFAIINVLKLKQMKSSNNKTIKIGLAASLVILLVISSLYFFKSKEMNEIVENLTIEKTILTEEYTNLALNYDSLHTNNDTLNKLLENERERINHLVEELKMVKATNMSKIREYQKELTTLRSVLRTYIVQIDSLNTINTELRKENIKYQQSYAKISSSYQQLETTKNELEKKVTIASQLEASLITVYSLTHNNRTTKKLSRIAKLEVEFAILKNLTAPVGPKDVYIRIERPDGELLMHSRDHLFDHDGSQINYSAKRIVEYSGEITNASIFYNVDTGELISGNYKVDIFADGFHIGNSEFSLR